MAKHRVFNADRFLDKFQGNEQLVRNFVNLWSGRIDLDPATLDLPQFKEWLVEGGGEAKDELLETLYEVYDLCREQGHEAIIAAITSDPEYDPDPEHALPVECLSLKVRTERDDLFNLAYGRYSLENAERFTIYKGSEPRRIENIERVAKVFEQKLAEVFKDHKNSDRVLLRHYTEGPYINFIVYHEKRTRATLVFQGTTMRPKVGPHIYRPAQQDFISYNAKTGQVEIEAGYENEEAKLRRCFAECCLRDAEFFEGDDAAKQISLHALADANFEFVAPANVNVSLVELKYSLNQKHGPRFITSSKDVFETLELNGLRRKLDGERLAKAVLKIQFPDDQRGKRVELSGPNRIKFKRATHADDVFRILKESGLLRAEEDDEDAAEVRAASIAFAGCADSKSEGDGAVSEARGQGARKKRSVR
jgi:hypothetical protein